MRYKIEKIPYYIMKLSLKPFGLENVASYWEEKQGYKKVCKKLDWSKQNYKQYDIPINEGVKINNTIWVYWKQGLNNAPKIVQKCIASAVKNRGERNIIILTERNIHDYIVLPDFIEHKHDDGIICEAHYSDLIRIQLLIQYGGIWMDATCYNTAPLPLCINEADFFMFSSGNWWPWLKNVSKCSNWFIKSKKDNILLQKLRNFLFEHWKIRNKPIHYYVFHFALSALTEYCEDCKSVWDDVPFISNMNPHLFMYSASKKYNKKQYEYIMSQCFIHKCSYKFNNDLLIVNDKNFIQHFMNNGDE